MKYRATILFFAICFAVSAAPHATFTPQLKKAFGYIVELRFDEAESIVQQQGKNDASNKVPDYLHGAMLCIELFVNEDQSRFEQSKDRIEQLIASIEELPADEPYKNLFLGELYIAQAILNGKYNNKIPAAWQFYKSYNYLTANYREFPEFMPTYVPLGVLYAAIGSLPDDYRSLASLLGFNGGVEEGIAMLRKSYYQLAIDREKNFYQPYAGFVYSFANFQLNPEKAITPQDLGLEVGSSSFLIYLQAQIELHDGNAASAVSWLDQRPEGNLYLDFHYLDYLQGKILLGLKPHKAKTLLQKYLRHSGSGVYVKSSYRYLSWYYLLEGDSEKAEEMREMVFKKGAANTGADRQALLEAGQPFNRPLIHARVLFDAAKFAEAKEVLQQDPLNKCCISAADQVEYHYRMGRILQEQNQLQAAVQSFDKALAVNGATASYALGNSALQLAIIFEKNENNSKARHYYSKTLKISDYPFYEGVHQKAKAGLARTHRT